MLIDLILASQDTPYFSPDGRFVYFVESGAGYASSVIQNVLTGEVITLGEPTVSDMDWAYIEGQSYLVYALPRVDGANTYYLLDPVTKAGCKFGSYFSYDIAIQAEDWMR